MCVFECLWVLTDDCKVPCYYLAWQYGPSVSKLTCCRLAAVHLLAFVSKGKFFHPLWQILFSFKCFFFFVKNIYFFCVIFIRLAYKSTAYITKTKWGQKIKLNIHEWIMIRSTTCIYKIDGLNIYSILTFSFATHCFLWEYILKGYNLCFFSLWGIYYNYAMVFLFLNAEFLMILMPSLVWFGRDRTV